MKKIFVMAILIVMIFSGCTSREEETMSLSSIAPNAKDMFEGAIVEVTDPEDGDVYQFIIKNGTRDMFLEYTNACREGIFTKPNCDIENNYQAYTEDGLNWISVSYFPGTETDPSNTYVYVDVRNVDKDDKG